MLPPKCRICGTREHNHRCTGGTPADRANEERRRRLMAAPRAEHSGDDGRPAAKQPEPPPAQKPPRRWHEDTDSQGEPIEVADTVRKPARTYAPAGQCKFCDERRRLARISMRSVRERGEA